MFIIRFLLLISIFLVIFIKTKRSLHMLQQNLYNENNRYVKWIFKNIKQLLNLDFIVSIICLIGILILSNLEKITIVAYVGIIIINFLFFIDYRKKIRQDQNKKPLVITKRVKRLICTFSIIYLIPIIQFINAQNNIKLGWIILLIISIMIVLNNFVVLIANIINYPVERIVYHYYKFKAQKKLKNMPNLKVIGITGSYGKTSCKNILNDILNIKYNALKTPRNLNTHYGLIMTINNDMDKFCEVFIAEMGAYVRGEIKELCNLVKPKYGILTTIGTAHLESFGSEEDIIKAKFELIESLPSDGFAILNGDDPKQVNYELKNNVKVIWTGIKNENVDVKALDIKCSNKGTSFEVKFPGDDKKYKFETKLLGDHNVYNILSAIACGYELGISIEELQASVKLVKPVEHRLQLKRIGNFYQIDDAYNSNPTGAHNACKILKMMPGLKVVVTPGMIELGDKEEYYNKEFGKQIADVADYVILIGEKKTKPIYEGLISRNFDKDKIIVYNDVRKSYTFINDLAMNHNDVYALFENDLPDTYNE